MASSAHSNSLHLCVLVHGLWGNPIHLEYLRETLQSIQSTDDLHILIPKSNKDNWTYDGIEVGAERITNEIEQTIRDLEQAGTKKVRRMSVVGYSLGGLVARYAIGLLYKSGVFDNIEPVNFTTFATPHLGVRTPKLGYRSQIWNILGSKTLSTSGQQMFLMDDFRETGRPLLSILADENSIFMKGLGMFKHRSLYANTLNDRSVPYYTASISRTDPFVDMQKVELNYLPDQQDPVLLHGSQPVRLRQERKAENLSLYQRFALTPETRAALPFYAVFFTLMPIAIPVFLVNSVYQTYKSAQRIRLHESGQAGLSLGRYRIPLLEDGQSVQERMLQRLASHPEGQEYLPTPPPEPAQPSGASSSSYTSSDDAAAEKLARTESAKESSPFPILALTQDQFTMIDNLDALGFQKFPCHIQRHRHTHAAIVVRTQKEGFAEGKAVVRHWAQRFEV